MISFLLSRPIIQKSQLKKYQSTHVLAYLLMLLAGSSTLAYSNEFSLKLDSTEYDFGSPERIYETVMLYDQRTLTGTVNGDDGNVLPGASVLKKGTSEGTTTDLDGNFSLEANTGEVLVVSYLGYETQEFTVGTEDSVSIILIGIEIEITEVSQIGSRIKTRTNLDRPVPVDVVEVSELHQTAQADVGQSLHYTIPSLSAVKFGINDLAPLVDQVTLRGLAPDQTLLLLNGKRRHKVSFFSLNDGIGKGELGNDINAIPSGAIQQVEVLRDGAAAQYGSDAIAGVINMQLKIDRSRGSIRTYYGTSLSNPKYDDLANGGVNDGDAIYDSRRDDGETLSVEANFGLPWGEDGFINTTLNFFKANASDRSGVYTYPTYYTDEQLAAVGISNEQLLAERGVELDRAVLGTAENSNGGIFINSGKSMGESWEFYAFGGLSLKEIVGGVFTRAPDRDSRSDTNIFYDGYNPELPAHITDYQLTSGFKGDLGNDWILDFSGGFSGNSADLYARNTINPSMGDNSPTRFYTGGLRVNQTVFNVDLLKPLLWENTTLALGIEQRFETFEQIQGDVEAWETGPLATDGKDVGASGREGFRPESDGQWERSNTGIYAEIESDLTDALLLGAALRYEHYSDFGSDVSYKLASRYKFADKFALRGSINRSFRAPALAQENYSNFSQIAFDNAGNSVVTPFLPTRDRHIQQAFNLSALEQETSINYSLGITSKLNDKFYMTLDAYHIRIDDRIMVAGFDATEFPIFDNLDYDEVNIFTNALNTSTKGLDFVAVYREKLDIDKNYGLSLAINLNETEVDGFNLPSGLQEEDISSRDIDYLTRGTPSSKMILTGDYRSGHFGFLTRFTRFGEIFDPRATYDDPQGNEQAQTFGAKLVTDLSMTAYVNENITITVSGNNLFDVYPDMLINPQTRGEVIYSRRTNQFGTQGRFLSLAMQYQW